jgi:hypothetical protein
MPLDGSPPATSIAARRAICASNVVEVDVVGVDVVEFVAASISGQRGASVSGSMSS